MSNGRFSGTRLFILANWPRFVLLYLGMVGALIVIGLSALRGWYAFVLLGTAVFIILVYFIGAGVWEARQRYDLDGITTHHVLFDMGQIPATERLAYVDLGLQLPPIGLSRRLTTGQIVVVDVYNPQWTVSAWLVRWRAQQPHPPADPRLSWREGNLNLLPLPNESVSTVMLCHIAGEFWQEGDRAALLREAYRILKPRGQLLLAESVRSQTNWLIGGPAGFNLPTAEYWRKLLQQAGYRIRSEKDVAGLSHCIRAQKPTPAEAQQLSFKLEF
ncbi:MAG: class I SAM-dependent methyltransferase [Ardenticatenaceae bacterium]|nr:class I SAM-dependent methyltransferase [Anaerolineales bacterium]MCB8941226.1 class I SAM-dependent methyltransferase [Ardenticatenaceae bacterium]MCB8972565.1 class I SAM-dependent methyltransferase [Ardenticatenaceae bacterium]